MRTTVTLDPDTKALLDRFMRSRRLAFKEALNEAIRRGLGPSGRVLPPVVANSHPMGEPTVLLDKALSLAGELEDEELIRKARVRK